MSTINHTITSPEDARRVLAGLEDAPLAFGAPLKSDRPAPESAGDLIALAEQGETFTVHITRYDEDSEPEIGVAF